MQVHRDIMDGRFVRRAVRQSPPGRAGGGADAKVEDGAVLEGPCFIDDGRVVKAGARIGPYSVIGRSVRRRRRRARSTAPSSGPTRGSASDAVVGAAHPRPQLPHRPERRASAPSAVLGDKSALTDYSQAVNRTDGP